MKGLAEKTIPTARELVGVGPKKVTFPAVSFIISLYFSPCKNSGTSLRCLTMSGRIGSEIKFLLEIFILKKLIHNPLGQSDRTWLKAVEN